MSRNYREPSRKERQQEEAMRQIQMLQGLKSLAPDPSEGLKTLMLLQGMESEPLQQELLQAQLADQQQRTAFSAQAHPVELAGRQADVERIRQQMAQSGEMHPLEIKSRQMANEQDALRNPLEIQALELANKHAGNINPLQEQRLFQDIAFNSLMNPLQVQDARLGIDQRAWQNAANQDDWQFNREANLFDLLSKQEAAPDISLGRDLQLQQGQLGNEKLQLEIDQARGQTELMNNLLGNPTTQTQTQTPAGGDPHQDFVNNVLPGMTPEQQQKLQEGLALDEQGGLTDFANPEKLYSSPALKFFDMQSKLMPNPSWLYQYIYPPSAPENSTLWDDVAGALNNPANYPQPAPPVNTNDWRDLGNPEVMFQGEAGTIPRELLRYMPNLTWFHPRANNAVGWDDLFRQLSGQ